jgi:hypothetical protein
METKWLYTCKGFEIQQKRQRAPRYHCLPQTSGLALPLEQAQNVILLDGALDVADDGAGRIVEKLNTNLSNRASVSSSAKNVLDLGQLYVLSRSS